MCKYTGFLYGIDLSNFTFQKRAIPWPDLLYSKGMNATTFYYLNSKNMLVWIYHIVV